MNSTNIRKKPEDRRQEIIDSALHLFLSEGYEQVTMSKIAKESGVVKGLCYHYFSTKKDIYEDALKIFVDDITKEFQSVIKNKEKTLSQRMDGMELVLKNKRGKSLFYEFSRKAGNERVFLQILHLTFQNLIPELVDAFRELNHGIELDREQIETMMNFLLHGQMDILVERRANFDSQIHQVREYINLILEHELKRKKEK